MTERNLLELRIDIPYSFLADYNNLHKICNHLLFGSFSLRWFSFVCSRESDVFFVSFSNVASNGLFLCIVYSPDRRHSIEMFWIDLTKAIISIRPGLDLIILHSLEAR